MDPDEASVKLIPRERDEPEKGPALWRLWKVMVVFVIFVVVCIWLVFTFYPSVEASVNELRNQQKQHSDLISSHKGNCTYMNTNQSLEWKGFQEIVPGTLVYSVYFDATHKNPAIRIIAISETFRPPKVYCHSLCADGDNQLAIFRLVSPGHKNLRHAAFILTCELPTGVVRGPRFVSISAEYDNKRTKVFTFPVTLATSGPQIVDYSVCVPPMFGSEITPTNLIEFIEMNQILGAQRFFIYNETINKELSKVINIYKRQGVVMVMPWKLPGYLQDFYAIHYHGQLVSIQDCLYRNRGRTKWLGFHDLDEFLVPLLQPSLTSLIKSIYRYDASGYCIRQVLFPRNNVFTAEDSKNNTLITQQYVFRTNTIFPPRKRSKCIIDPMKVYEMGIHFINKPVYGNYKENWVNPKQALVFHYRQCVKYPDLKKACRSTTADGFMFKYKETLSKRINQMLQMMKN